MADKEPDSWTEKMEPSASPQETEAAEPDLSPQALKLKEDNQAPVGCRRV